MFSLNRIKEMNDISRQKEWRPLNEREKVIRQTFKERVRKLQGIKGKSAGIERAWLETERRMFKNGERSIDQMEDVLGLEKPNFNKECFNL